MSDVLTTLHYIPFTLHYMHYITLHAHHTSSPNIYNNDYFWRYHCHYHCHKILLVTQDTHDFSRLKKLRIPFSSRVGNHNNENTTSFCYYQQLTVVQVFESNIVGHDTHFEVIESSTVWVCCGEVRGSALLTPQLVQPIEEQDDDYKGQWAHNRCSCQHEKRFLVTLGKLEKSNMENKPSDEHLQQYDKSYIIRLLLLTDLMYHKFRFIVPQLVIWAINK